MEPTFDIFTLPEIVQLILEHFTNSCPVNGKGLSMWFGVGLVCKLFRVLQLQLLEDTPQIGNNNNVNQQVVRSMRQRGTNSQYQIVQAAQLFLQHKAYQVTIHTHECNPLIVESTRKLKPESKIELVVNYSNDTISSYMSFAPHYPTFFDATRQRWQEALKHKQECFCLFHFRRGYFGFIIQCKVENVSKKSNIKQSVRLVKVYQTQSVRYYGQVQQEANKHPSVYSAALYYLLKDFVKYNTFYISLSTKRKRDFNNDDDEESQVDRTTKKARRSDDQFYSWKRNDLNFERYPAILVVGEQQEEAGQENDNPSECSCTLL